MSLKTKNYSLNAFVQANKVIEKQSQDLDAVFSRFESDLLKKQKTTRPAESKGQQAKVAA